MIKSKRYKNNKFYLRSDLMDLLTAIETRHSVRSYTDRKIEGKVKEELLAFIDQCNLEGNLNMQLVLDEPQAFSSKMAHYGKFNNVKNYIAVIGNKDANLAVKCGYYGEKVVLKAQQLGLNTCWVALTYKKVKQAMTIKTNEKLELVIAIGYGTDSGSTHKSKSLDQVIDKKSELPQWFKDGVKAALLAPTAMNQQKFVFSCHDKTVSLKRGTGFYSKIDLGIVKYHFEIGAHGAEFVWKIK